MTARPNHAGSIVEGLLMRRATIVNRDLRDNSSTAIALVPLANMLGYDNVLKSASQGLGKVTSRFAGYELVPKDTAAPPPTAAAQALRA